ncbi:MAG: phosphatase PAP2 family protein [Dongiaceae bacterium]
MAGPVRRTGRGGALTMPSSIEVSALDTRRTGWLASFVASLRENSPLLVLVALYLAGADGLSALLGTPHRSFDGIGASYDGYVSMCIAALAVAFIVWILHVTLVRKNSIQSRATWRLVGTEFFNRDRVLLALPILLVWPVLARAFSLVKALIPLVHPYSLDPLLHQIDRAIHFGHDPWALLQPILGYPIVTYSIDFLYALWLFVMYFALLLQITTLRDRRVRAQFLISSILAWTLLGGVLAIALSSVGPCYYALVVGGPDPYAAQIAYLRETVPATHISIFGFDKQLSLIAVTVQDMLWDFYQQADFGFGRGISAAPSMHVASTWLVARMIQTYGRRAAIFGWGFFAVILIGSIHLGWHYATDGYVAIAGAWALWRLTGWWLDRPAVKSFLFAPARA